MNIKKIIREELEGFKDSTEEDWEWTKGNEPWTLPKNNFNITIKLCGTHYGTDELKDKMAELYPELFKDLDNDWDNLGRDGYKSFDYFINWFGNPSIDAEHGEVYLYLSNGNNEYNIVTGWNHCDIGDEFNSYKLISPEEFLSLYWE